ncbi:MAG: hypothetical protein H6720_28995 [Sandaracinus sp.]|nr:hypothetical protein [Sandaracinus sp.]
MIQLLGATPLAAACGSSGASPDAGGIDAGASDAFVADAFSGDAASSDAAQVCAPTHDDALGPFFEDGAPSRTELAALDEPGQRLFVQGTLVDAACRPLEGYVLDVWQADAEGNYPDAAASGYRLRGRLVTAADGTFALESIVPGYYETPTGPRPAHLHVRVWNTAGVDRLVTQLYFAGDRFLGPADGCQPPTCFSGDADRVLALEPGRVNGRDGVIARPRLVLA